MRTSLRKFYTAGIFIFFLVSCSKDNPPVTNNNPPNPPPVTPPVVPAKVCQIIAAAQVGPNGDTVTKYTYTYYDDGRLKGSREDSMFPDTVSYTYNGKLIYRAVAAGINSSVDTITLNDAGFETHMKEVIGTKIYSNDWVYDNNMQLKTFTQQQDSYPPSSAFYTFANGDNTLSTDGTFGDTLTYDTSKLAVLGNMDHFTQLLSFGAMNIKNKHLLITEKHGQLVNYSYTFNGEGNIETMSINVNGSQVSKFIFTYDCK